MAVAGSGKTCYRFVANGTELVNLSRRQEVSVKVMNDIPAIIEQLQAGKIVYVSSVYPTVDHLRLAWLRLHHEREGRNE